MATQQKHIVEGIMASTEQGDSIRELTLPNIDGSEFNIEAVKGKRFLLSFYRFAACPFCNLRIHEMVSRYDSLPGNFEMIAVFDSPLANLQRFTSGHHAPLPQVPRNTLYSASFVRVKEIFAIVIG